MKRNRRLNGLLGCVFALSAPSMSWATPAPKSPEHYVFRSNKAPAAASKAENGRLLERGAVTNEITRTPAMPTIRRFDKKDVEKVPGQVRGEATTTPQSASDEPDAKNQNQLRSKSTGAPVEDAELASIRARALLELDDVEGARTEAESALAINPNDVGALRVIATIYELNYQERRAANTWEQVFELTGDEAAEKRVEEIRSANPSELRITTFYEGSPDVDEQMGVRAAVALRPRHGPEWDIQLEHREADMALGTRLDGTQAPISQDGQRLDISASETFAFGKVRATAVVSAQGVGAKASVSLRKGPVTWEVSGGYEEPYWLYSEGLQNEATVDSVGVGATYNQDRFGVRASIRAQDFGVADDDSVAQGYKAVVGADFKLSTAENPLTLAYAMDKESFDEVETRILAGGAQTYTPLPFVDREVHSLGLYKTFGDRRRRYAVLGAGYRKDRLGIGSAEGPYANIEAETPLTDRVKVGVRAEYSEASTRGEGSEPYAFGQLYIRRRF